MSGDVLAYAGLALVAGALASWFRRVRTLRIPRDRTVFVAAWCVGAALGAAGLLRGTEWLAGVAAVSAGLLGGLLTFTVARSAQRTGPGAIAVGDRIPRASAPDEHDTRFSLASTAGRPLLLKFFRGHW